MDTTHTLLYKVWHYFTEYGVTTFPLQKYRGVVDEGGRCGYYKRPIASWGAHNVPIPVDHWSEDAVIHMIEKGHGMGIACSGWLIGFDIDEIVSGHTISEIITWCDANGIPYVRTKKGIHILAYNTEIVASGTVTYRIGPFTVSGEIRSQGNGYLVAPGTKWAATDTEVAQHGLHNNEGIYEASTSLLKLIEDCVPLPEVSVEVLTIPKNVHTNTATVRTDIAVSKSIRKYVKPYIGMRIFEVSKKEGGYEFREGIDRMGRHGSLLEICKEIRDKAHLDGISAEELYTILLDSLRFVRDQSCQDSADKTDDEIDRIVTDCIGYKEAWLRWVGSVDWNDKENMEHALQSETDDFKKKYIQQKLKLLSDRIGYNETVSSLRSITGSKELPAVLPWNKGGSLTYYNNFALYMQALHPYTFYCTSDDSWYIYDNELGFFTRNRSDVPIDAIIKKQAVADGYLRLSEHGNNPKIRSIALDWKTNVHRRHALRGISYDGEWSLHGSKRTAYRFLINVSNGVLNLDTKELLPHNGIYEFKGRSNAVWSPVRVFGVWEKFLRRLSKTQEEYDMLCVCITTFCTNRAWGVAWGIKGPTGSGKNTLMNGISAVLGSIGESALMTKRTADSIDSRFGMAGIEHYVGMWIDETLGRATKSDAFKTIVSGGPVAVESKGVDVSTAISECTLVFTTNEILRFSQGDNSLAHRIRYIELHDTIRDTAEDDKDFERKLSSPEGMSELLHIICYGFSLLKADDFHVRNTARSLELTSETLLASDPMRHFTEEYCDISPLGNLEDSMDFRISSKELRDALISFAVENNYKSGSMTSQTFIAEMGRLGFTYVKSLKIVQNGIARVVGGFRGIRLKERDIDF